MTYVSLKGLKFEKCTSEGGDLVLAKYKLKTYPDGSQTLYAYSDCVLVGEDAESSGGRKKISDDSGGKQGEQGEQDKEHSKMMNVYRTRNKIKDYCLSNDFDMFWTLTFGDARDDDLRCFQRLGDWLKRMKAKYGLFDYIFIPERHKDGCIHFHGVTGGFGGVMVDSGKVEPKSREIVYNCENWRYGFSTVTMIRSRRKTASYITKYVTKNLGEGVVPKGKKKYWSSRGLREPVIEYYEQIPLAVGKPDWENERVAIYKF